MSDIESVIAEEVQRFQQTFTGAELNIIALTGARSASYGNIGNEESWMATIPVTAWRLQDDTEIQQGDFILTGKGEEEQLMRLFSTMEANQIWHMNVRRQDNRLLLLKLKQQQNVAQESHLARLLEEQTREITIEHERLGTFILDRRVNTFNRNIEWLGVKVRVSLEHGEQMHIQLDNLAHLLDHAAQWDESIRMFAAQELIELKNDSWLEEDEEEWSEANFAKQLSLVSITFSEEDFTFWFDDGDLFWGHAVYVSNTIEDGPYDANIGG